MLPPSEKLQSDLAVYLTAAELTRRELIVATTTVNAPEVDLFATDQNCRRSWSIQVKKNSGLQRYWPPEKWQRNWLLMHMYTFLFFYSMMIHHQSSL
jgi:hypothetical protein